MTLQAQSLAFVTLLLLLLVIIFKTEANVLVHDYAINNISEVNETSAAAAAAANAPEPPVSCRNRPFACNFGEFPPRSLCCGDRCVDITSDTTNCGLCGIRCAVNYSCCNRLCINTYINPFNCGRCGRVCPFGTLCLFGSCGGVPEPPPPTSMPPPPTPFTVPPTSLPPPPPTSVPPPPTPFSEPPTSMPPAQNPSQSLNHQSPEEPPEIM